MTETQPVAPAAAPRRRLVLTAAVLVVLVLAGGLGYYWLKSPPPAQVSVEKSAPIFQVTKTDLRGQTLQNVLTKIAFPQSVYTDHVGDVWVVDTTGGPSRVLMPIPQDTEAWTVTAVCFRALTPDETAVTRSLAPGQKPATNFITLGIQRTDSITPQQLAGIVQGTQDDTLPGCSFGVSGMDAYRPGSGPTIRVQ